uniref:Sucrose responsive element binding factor 1 n=1 Tax=Solanum tuberosum TaxID=4113 RepID=M1DNR2_SOLTU
MKKKGKIEHRYWNPEEDKQLQKIIEKYGAEHWSLKSSTVVEEIAQCQDEYKSRFPQLCLYPPITSLGGILPLSPISPVMSDPSTSLSLSLPRFRSSNNLN